VTQTSLTILNRYQLLDSPADFTTAITALAARVQAEGDPGVLSYRFYVGNDTAHAVIDYANPSAWIGHHDIAMAWPEMQALHAVARLADVTFLGPLTDEIRAYLAGSNLKAQIDSGYTFAAGFQRAREP
jgi:hypothetical protein